MKVNELLSDQLKEAHQGFLGTLDGITDDQANFQPPGRALSVAAAWVHLVESEDTFIAAITGQPLMESSDFAGKAGFNHSQPTENWAEAFPKWAKTVKVNTDQLLAFTTAVFAKSEVIVAQLSEDDLAKTHDLGSMGAPTALHIVSAYIVGHCFSVTGELSAVKGIQGLKGYPW